MTRNTTSRPPAVALAAVLGLATAVGAEVGVTDAPKGVVVNTRNGKAYAAFRDLGIVKIVNGAAGPVVTLETGANVKNLTIDPRSGRVYAMNRGPGTISVIDPDTDAIIDTLKADRGSLTALNPATNKLYVSASTGTNPSVIDLATKSATTIHAGTEGNALSGSAVEIWTLPLDLSDPEHPRAGKPEPFLTTAIRQVDAAVSPDGKWIAYSSNESGIDEIFVRSFPGPGGKWRVSTASGKFPAWSRTGHELFNLSLADGRIMVANYTIQDDSFRAAKPRVWSDRQVLQPNFIRGSRPAS